MGGAFQGQRRAINSQRSNLGITNVVSADQVGKFPDSNIGDALKRISGINVQYDQGEARFGQVRGTSADLSSVTINGNRVPSAEGETRSVQLDLIPADMIQTIEVNKVVTPDMDADAIGGSINLVTKNSPYKRTIAATAGTGYNWVSGKAALNLGFTYGDRFFNDKLGLMVSASYQNNPAGSDDVEMAYERNEDGEVVLDEYEVRQYYVTRERQSYSLALDWEINANHKIDFKGIFNNRNDWENRYRHTYKWDDETPNEYEVIYETKSGGPDQRYARLERQRTMDFTLGGEHLFGKLKFDWKASYAQAGEERPHERYLAFKKEGVAMNTDWSDIRRPYMSPVDGQNILLDKNNDNGFELDELTEQFEDINEKDLKFSANFELPLAKGKYSNKLKFGAKVVDKNKDMWIDFYEYSPTDEERKPRRIHGRRPLSGRKLRGEGICWRPQPDRRQQVRTGNQVRRDVRELRGTRNSQRRLHPLRPAVGQEMEPDGWSASGEYPRHLQRLCLRRRQGERQGRELHQDARRVAELHQRAAVGARQV